MENSHHLDAFNGTQRAQLSDYDDGPGAAALATPPPAQASPASTEATSEDESSSGSCASDHKYGSDTENGDEDDTEHDTSDDEDGGDVDECTDGATVADELPRPPNDATRYTFSAFDVGSVNLGFAKATLEMTPADVPTRKTAPLPDLPFYVRDWRVLNIFDVAGIPDVNASASKVRDIVHVMAYVLRELARDLFFVANPGARDATSAAAADESAVAPVDGVFIEAQPMGGPGGTRNARTFALSHVLQAAAESWGIPVYFITPLNRTKSYSGNKAAAVQAATERLASVSLLPYNKRWLNYLDSLRSGEQDDAADALMIGLTGATREMCMTARETAARAAAEAKRSKKRQRSKSTTASKPQEAAASKKRSKKGASDDDESDHAAAAPSQYLACAANLVTNAAVAAKQARTKANAEKRKARAAAKAHAQLTEENEGTELEDGGECKEADEASSGVVAVKKHHEEDELVCRATAKEGSTKGALEKAVQRVEQSLKGQSSSRVSTRPSPCTHDSRSCGGVGGDDEEDAHGEAELESLPHSVRSGAHASDD